jgi:hypothetical protein
MGHTQDTDAQESLSLSVSRPGVHDILLDFERPLSPMFREVGLIGEIPLSDDEETKIEAALRELLRSGSPSNATQFLREEAPCTLACFLVWKGIRGYREGDYWSEVCESANLPQANWPQKWGEIFEDVLQRFRLPNFRDRGGLRFVTPILIHGGIPDYCLDDFFERLVWPAVIGRLNYEGNIHDLLAEWQERPSLTQSTDKPVRRFLEQGGKAASDFLQRCLDMAFQAYETGQISSAKDLGLPGHVVERFAAWLKRTSPETSSQTHPQTDLLRYRAPEIILHVAAGCLLLSFPSQRLIRSKLNSAQLKLEVQRDGALLATTSLRGAVRGEWIETDSHDLDLGAPGKQYEVTLFSGEKPLRRWMIPGVSQDQQWMIFHGRSGRLLPERAITERDFWIIFSAPWEPSTATQAVEAATLTQDYQAMRFCIAEGILQDIRLIHPDGKSFSIPIEGGDAPTLSGASALAWPRVSSGDFEVYSGTLPDLLIPLPVSEHGPVVPERLHLTITPIGEAWPAEKREIPLKNFAEVSNLKDHRPTLPLSDPRLLGPTPCGRFTIQVRGRLGQDTTFHLCFLPEINLNFPRDALLPNPNTGSQDLSFMLESPHLQELTAESPAEVVLQDSTSNNEARSYRVVVPAESEQVVLRPRFSVGERTVGVPLEITVPRLRWTVSGLNGTSSLHWRDRTLILSLQDLEEASEPRLLVRGDFGQDLVCTLLLQGADHRSHFALKNGKGGCPLSPFLDSLRESGLSRNDFYLEFALPGEDSPRRIFLLQVETRWRVEDLQVVQELIPAEDKRSVLLWWHDKGNVKNRVLRLWNLSSQPKGPIEVVIADGRSEAEIERPSVDFPHGQYRLEFVVLDPWVGSPPSGLPNPYGSNVFDLDVREDEIIVLPSLTRYTEVLLEKITTGAAISDLTLDPQALQVFTSTPEQAGRFCRALYVREERQRDSLALLRQALQQCGEEQDSFAESLAGFLTEGDRPGIENTVHFFAGLFASLGFLNRRWGPHLKNLLLSTGGDSDFLEEAEEHLPKAREEITTFYAQATWQSLDSTRRFFQRLRSISGELVYQDQTLLKLEGIVTQHGEELLRWWCGEKRVKGKTVPSWVSVSLKEAAKIFPRHLRPVGVLCLTATLQRAGAYGALYFSEQTAERLNPWGSFFYRTRGQEYRRELRWAEETFAR